MHLDLHRDKTQPEATQWVFSRPDGTRFLYSQATGLPTSVVDLNDNTMTFTHDADGRLISVRDAKGRTTLTLGWEPKRGSNTGRLQWLRDISGRFEGCQTRGVQHSLRLPEAPPALRRPRRRPSTAHTSAAPLRGSHAAGETGRGRAPVT